jgi:class 3 adenylate cyclase/tetratricopeptide (TPR) repeat protein
MDCPRCESHNPPSATTCAECREPLARHCDGCGGGLPVAAAFCPACGRRASGARAEQGAADPLLGQRRPATVLFSDLSGYTALTERLDPEDVALVLDRLKTAATRIVESHGGTVNQFVGDQVMALFGVPVAHDQDPVRAVQAALALHGFVREFANELEPRLGCRLALHTGIDTGVVVARKRDARDGLFGVTGDAVNTGARLSQAAGSDEILLGPATFASVAPYFATEPLGPIELRGKSGALPVHRVVGIVARSPFEVAERRGLSRFVGRRAELALFRASLEAAARGLSGVFAVSGEPGVGKSRLFHEFRRIAAVSSVRVGRARCEAVGTVVPYAPFVHLLRELLELGEEEHEATAALAVERIRALSPELEPHLPVLLHVASLRSPAHVLPPPLLGEALQQAVFSALVAFLRVLAQGPAVLLLEDWHLADESSQLALRNLVPAVRDLPLVLWINHRPHPRLEWVEPPTFLELQPLSEDEAEKLVTSLLDSETLPAAARDAILARTGGNPFFIEEVCRSVAETRALDGGAEPGGGALAPLRVPASVETVVRARIDRLDARAGRVIRSAAVLGMEFSLPLLERLSDDPELASTIETLCAAGLVETAQRGERAAWRFKHAITQEVAYGLLLHGDRRVLHEAAGRAVESQYAGERLAAHFEELAHHFARGHDRDKAVHYLRCAGDKAAAAFALEQARALYGEAVALLGGRHGSDDEIRRRVDLIFRWAQTGWYGPTQQQVRALEDALALARGLRDREREMRCVYFSGWLAHTMGESRRAIEHFERCIEMADPGDPRWLSQLYCNLGQNLANDAQHDRALECLEKGVALRRSALPARARTIGMAYALSYIGLVQADRGARDACRRHLDEAFAIIDPMGHGSALASINQVRMLCHALLGDWEEALEYARLGRRVSQSIGARTNHGMARAVEGWCELVTSDGARGLDDLAAGLDEMDAHGSLLGASIYWAALGEGAARAGDPRAGEAHARRALERAASGDRFGEAAAWRALGIALAARGPAAWAQASEAFAAAHKFAEARSSPREAALTDVALAEQLGRRGESARARELAERALAALATLALPGHQARARSVRAALG